MAFDLNNFNYRPHTIKRSLDQYIYGQEDVKKSLSVAFWQHYSRLKRKLENPRDPLIPKNKPNILLLGSTGTGKTLNASTICKLLGVPYQFVDSTDYSEAGYVGENVLDIPKQLYETARRDIQQAELGVIHIDEIDKKAASLGEGDDVSRGGVQGGFLTLIQGKEVLVDSEVTLNTENVLFIASGAFEGIENIIKTRLKNQLGFGSKPYSKSMLSNVRPTIEDLEKFGMNRQLLGRFPIHAYTDSFKGDDLYQILKLEKNPLIPDLISDFADLGITINVEDEAYRHIGKVASKTPLGARSLAQIVNNTFREALYELGERDISEIIIDKKFIDDPKARLAEIVKGAKLREKQELIVANGLCKKKRVESLVKTMVKTKKGKWRKKDYSILLNSYGLRVEYIRSATDCGVKHDIDPHDIFFIIADFDLEVDELQEHFKEEFKKYLDITDECRSSLVNMGLYNFGEKLVALIYEPIWSKFEEKTKLIKESKKDIITLGSIDPDDLGIFFDGL